VGGGQEGGRRKSRPFSTQGHVLRLHRHLPCAHRLSRPFLFPPIPSLPLSHCWSCVSNILLEFGNPACQKRPEVSNFYAKEMHFHRPATRFLKHIGRNWPNPVCSFYLPAPICLNPTAFFARVFTSGCTVNIRTRGRKSVFSTASCSAHDRHTSYATEKRSPTRSRTVLVSLRITRTT